MDKKLTILMSIFFLSFLLFISIMVFNKPLTRFTRAKEEYLPSSQTSLIFAWPLTVKLDNNQSANINVFVRNATNLPLANKKVSLTTTLGQIKEIQPTTDKTGKATFILTSQLPGIAEITATVDNQTQLNQKISIKFE